jgi:hypothetical protein
MTKTLLLAGAAAFALTGSAFAGGVHPTAGVTGHAAKIIVSGSPKGSKTLYDQNQNYSGSANTSQNFETSFDQYDNSGADDFVVPAGHKWTISEVDVTGVYRYTGGSAAAADVLFYKNKGGLPSNKGAVASCLNVPTNDTGATGNFTLQLAKAGCTVKLKAGTYWVAVAADLSFQTPEEQWYWGTTADGTIGNAAAWHDPNGGWAALGIPSDCNKWQTLSHCLGSADDWMFALKGKDKS